MKDQNQNLALRIFIDVKTQSCYWTIKKFFQFFERRGRKYCAPQTVLCIKASISMPTESDQQNIAIFWKDKIVFHWVIVLLLLPLVLHPVQTIKRKHRVECTSIFLSNIRTSYIHYFKLQPRIFVLRIGILYHRLRYIDSQLRIFSTNKSVQKWCNIIFYVEFHRIWVASCVAVFNTVIVDLIFRLPHYHFSILRD